MLVLALVLASVATIDDGWLVAGGSPAALRKHPTVEMRSEDVRIFTDGKVVRVECDFTFVNHGPACDVRMGFPDRQVWGGDDVARPQPTMDDFRSWVDGAPVATEVVKGSRPLELWRAKTIRFAAGQTRRVRDSYRQRIGIAATNTESGLVYARALTYVFHTGATWRGPIGYARLRVTFGDFLPSNLRIRRPKGSGADVVLDANPKPTDVYTGLRPLPHVTGRTLEYVRRNWTPTEADDPIFLFGYRPYNGGDPGPSPL